MSSGTAHHPQAAAAALSQSLSATKRSIGSPLPRVLRGQQSDHASHDMEMRQQPGAAHTHPAAAHKERFTPEQFHKPQRNMMQGRMRRGVVRPPVATPAAAERERKRVDLKRKETKILQKVLTRHESKIIAHFQVPLAATQSESDTPMPLQNHAAAIQLESDSLTRSLAHSPAHLLTHPLAPSASLRPAAVLA